ncbi:putative Integrin alpha N-terminal domain protein [Vibrio nigripulchritudo SFn27]|uniref:Putative Integrin alpha N-terminal domain protein n=1 Tax=Vibrio nigripulchritudo TaxID=28173 RepID=U4K1F2_9VIBR|nr:VCBS repeat-containing protein [Vibrio nigripulchritudo]CCN80546.1 putative Integrin alpha N-terminal domain protein [Vibrio nigripulchritudo BLFn1]CCN91191.1 putative Integrin alpha N-terminal domain protein [Vibrio nigripulchritudo SFn27]CCN97498.1 putative Integrin alpha N-terminal domain protein [Vibrio nigripulchritudo ENn2]CCO40252.1 putative Integrin alpha N-terminal domain protein [Vibrio nigripulchritudo SFn135]CCO53178.1 putative Integrin alpha N-terminal domain protein [Vibrio ni
MLRQLKASSVLGIAILLTACGGGGSGSNDSGSSTSEQKKTEEISQASKTLKNATQHTPEELKKAAYSLVEHGYAGKSNVAQLNETVVRQASVAALSSEYSFIFRDDQIRDFLSLKDVAGKSFTCGVSGFVDIHSTLNEEGLGILSLDFKGCVTSHYKVTISGVLALSSESNNQKSYYFNELDINGVKVTGYTQSYYSEIGERGYEQTGESRLFYSYSDGKNTKLELTESQSSPDYYTETNVGVKGTVWLGESGKVNVSSQGLKARSYNDFYVGSLSFKADTEIQLSFSDEFFTYKKDLDGDGSFELGTHLSKLSGFQFVLMQPVDLYPFDLLTQPPAFTGTPTQSSYDLNTETPIVVESSEFSDPDTPAENLQLSYRWYINGEMVAGATTNTLPAYMAAYGDEVKVQAVVFDGTSSIVSEWGYISLNDTKPVIKTDNLPAQVFAGDELQFGASLFDVDTNGSESVRMESGPDGATISSDGVVSWTVPSDFLFPIQTFEFTFKSNNYDYQEYLLEVEVNGSVEEPIVRSGQYSSFKEDSIVIDDFDGDGLNEFLTTDNGSGLSLYHFENGKYKQKWMYPYQLPSNSSIQHVQYLDVDSDLKKEIIIVTSKSILVLEDLSSRPKVVFKAPQNILRAAFADTDADGELEVAILHYEWHSSNTKLSIYGWNDFSFPIVKEFDTSGSSQLNYANVDNDQALELVLDGGLAIDTSTWEVQWNYNGQFSQGGIVVEDFNQDGVNEIVGKSNDNQFYMYSAATNTLTELSSNQRLSWCNLIKTQLTLSTMNVLLMNCVSNEIKAFKIEGNVLTQLWELNTPIHNEINSLTVGDMDNDKDIEMLWGGSGNSGYLRSGFASADISEHNASLKHTNIEESTTVFRAVGWAKVTPVREEALFLVGSSANWDVKNKFATVDTGGDVTFSRATSYSGTPLRNTVSMDSNEDGYSEIFLAEGSNFTSYFELLELSDESVASSHELSVGDGSTVKSAELNRDGKNDIVFASGARITMYDVVNRVQIATYEFSADYTYIRDFEVYDETAGLIVVSEGIRLSLLQVVGSSVTVKSTYENSDFGCEKVLVFNHDSDSSKEVACFTEHSNQLLVFEVAENSLALKASYDLNFETIGIAVNTSQLNEQGFIVTTREHTHFDSSSSYQFHVRGLDYKGDSLWKSPPLIGVPSQYGIKLRNHPEKGLQALVSTNQAMYQINP